MTNETPLESIRAGKPYIRGATPERREKIKAKAEARARATAVVRAARAAARAANAKPLGRPKLVRNKENPFSEGSNSAEMTEQLKIGGKRIKIATDLSKIIRLSEHENMKSTAALATIDRRVVMVAKTLEQDFGWTIEREGVGRNGSIRATPPSYAKVVKTKTPKIKGLAKMKLELAKNGRNKDNGK